MDVPFMLFNCLTLLKYSFQSIVNIYSVYECDC